MAQKTLILSGLAFALALGFTPAAHAAAQQDSCTANFTNAAGKGEDMKAASILLEKAGNCCATDLSSGEVQGLINDIKSIMANANKSITKGGDKNDAGKVMSSALDCAGQPSLVAADPTFYSEVLADSAQIVELAQDENATGDLPQLPNFARNPVSFQAQNNQQPTVSVEQK